MGWITLLLSGVPAYVPLDDLAYYLECIFTTNSEIGMFEVRHLPEENDMPLVALDFPSGFDAIAAQEQLDGYRYQMQNGVQYILRTKITNKKEYLRGDKSPQFSLNSRSPSMEKENSSAVSISSMSDGAMLRANAKLDAKYKFLKKQKLIVETEMKLLRERRKLRREYARKDLDSDDEPCCSRKPRLRSTSREHRSFSPDQNTYKIKRAAKIQELKAIDCYDKESASISKLRSPQWDKDFEKQSRLEIKSKSNSQERSLSKIQEDEKKSRVRSRAVRSRSLTRSSNSRSRSPSPKPLRSGSRTRRSSHNSRRSCSRGTESRDRYSKRITKRKERSHDRISRSKRLRSPDRSSRSKRLRSPDRFSRSKRLRSPDRMSRSKRLRSPESDSRSRKSRSRNRYGLLAIMPKSPVKGESSILRTQPSNWKEYKNTGSDSYGTQPSNWKEYKHMESNTYRTQPSNWKEYKNVENKDCKIPVVLGKIKNTDKKIIEDTFRNIDTTDKKEDFKNNPIEMKEGNADRKRTRSDETIIRLICDDIMFLMKSLLLEISIKDNIVISDSTNKLMIEELNIVVQKRVKILYGEKKLTIYNAWEIYRKICTKEDDILLLKTMLAEINTQEAGTAETENQNTLAEGGNGNDSAENSNQAISNVELDTVTHDSTVKYENRNEDEVTEQTNLETDNGNKATDVVEVIDIETYCPKESSIKATEKQKIVQAQPQFVLVIKRLMRQFKSALRKNREKGVFVSYFHMKQVLKTLLTDMLNGEEYKTTPEIINFFRQKYPRDKDEEFIENLAEDYKMKKCDLDAMDRERQEDTDVILVETKPEIVSIEDSDGESDDIDKEITDIISSLNELTESQTTNEVLCLLEKETVKEAVTTIVEPKGSEKTNENNKCINDLMKCQKTNEADNNSNIELTEICNMVIKQEEQQPGETVKDQTNGHIYAGIKSREPINENTTINKEVQRTETEFSEINKDNREEALKVTAITIVTSESELHSIATEMENKDSKEILKEELTDEDIEKKHSLEDIGLDIDFLRYKTSDPCELESPQVGSGLHGNCDGYNTNDACEKETPIVTSITIMTSTAELQSLKFDGNGNTVKEVPEVKVENNEEVFNETAVQVDEHIENEALGDVNDRVGNITNTEMICPESQDKQVVDDEAETIESICKYVTSLCNGS